MNLADKRKQSLINIVYFVVLLTLYYLFVKFAFWIVAPFIFALIIAMVLQKPINYLSGKSRYIRKKPLAVVFVLLLVALIIGIIVLIGYLAGTEFYNFFKFMSSKVSSIPGIIERTRDKIETLIVRLPDGIEASIKEMVDGIANNVLGVVEKGESQVENAGTTSASSIFNLSMLASPLGGIWSTAKQIPAVFTAILISIIACFFITSDYEGFMGLIKNAVSEKTETALVKAKHVVIDVLGKWCKSYATILFITFCEMSVGLWLLKITHIYNGGYIFVIAICTAIMDILPVFGTGTVLVPWAVVCLFTHNAKMAIGLLVIYAVITVIRQIIEPKLVSANVDMHPVLTLMSMYIGLQIFGVFGIIILPISVIILKTLNREGVVHLWGRYNVPSEETESLAEDESESETESVSVNVDKKK